MFTVAFGLQNIECTLTWHSAAATSSFCSRGQFTTANTG